MTFDNTISAGTSFPHFDEGPSPGAKEALETLSSIGHKIIIYTCRMTPGTGSCVYKQYMGLLMWLKQHEIPYHEVYIGLGKPLADQWIDDKCIEYDGKPSSWAVITERFASGQYHNWVTDEIRAKRGVCRCEGCYSLLGKALDEPALLPQF